MTHKFKPGDRVRIVRKGTDDEMKGRGWNPSMDKFIGTTQTIEQVTFTSHNITPRYTIVEGHWDFPECILEKAEELPAKSEMPRFKAGDKVRFISCEQFTHETAGSPEYCEKDELKIGEIYTIEQVSGRGNYSLEGKEFYHDPRRFEAVSSEPIRKKFKAGDKVRCMHLDKIPREKPFATKGDFPHERLAKEGSLVVGGIYTVNRGNAYCDDFDDYLDIKEFRYVLCPDRFELVEEEKYDIGVDTSLPIGLSSALCEQTKELAELREKVMDKVWRDGWVWLPINASLPVMKPEISDEDLLLLL